MTPAFTLRGYQSDLRVAIDGAWAAGARNVCAVLPTGGGKTVIFASLIADTIAAHGGPAIAIAHRQELVGQISLALARYGVRHSIIAPTAVVKACVQIHMRELGTTTYDPGARTAVAGVDTMIRRDLDWSRFKLWVCDECAHLLVDNKWGKAVALMPNALGLGLTATPVRADGKGLGRHHDGVFDTMVEGPDMRWLIDNNHLTEYRIFAPLSDIDLSQVKVGASGDFALQGVGGLVAAVRKSQVVGDVVGSYLRICGGMRGLTFATDLQTASDIAEAYRAAGVAAEFIDGTTPARERAAASERLRRGETLQLVNVDLFGEGYDLPAVECASFARPTQSYGLYAQQFGRPLRLMDGKPVGTIIDHVGNVMRHGLPDAPRVWSLDRRDARRGTAAADIPQVRVCLECAGVYPKILKACPLCGEPWVPESRASIEFVDGDITELSAEVLAAMRGEVAHADRDVEVVRAELAAKHAPLIGQMAGCKRHAANKEAQMQLRETMAQWAGSRRNLGNGRYIAFYLTFGVDVLGAQILKEKDANDLRARIEATRCTRYTNRSVQKANNRKR